MKTNDQLIKKAKETGNYQNIYPIAYIDGIIDKESNEKLSDILIRYNHILVPWQGSVTATRNRVTLLMRRQGLWITYLNEDSEIVTEVYKGSAKDIITNWADDINWEIIPDMEYVQNNASKIPDGAILPQHLSKELQEMLLSSGKVTNLPDNEDLTTQGIALKFKDREYNPEQASGKGYKILRKNWTIVNNRNINLLTQEMINNIKTVYEIRYDFNLNGQTINIPNGSILDFKGGSIDNGTINFPEGTYIRNLYKGTAAITGSPTYIDYLADEEDVTTENGILKFKDKEYSSSDFSGLGRKYLRKNIVDGKNILTQDMINSSNTIYIIQYDYDLNEETITIPEGCVLQFEGGSISNGNLNLVNTTLMGPKILVFDNVVFTGKCNNSYLYPEWFGAKKSEGTDDSNAIQQAINLGNVFLSTGTYYISNPITIKRQRSIVGGNPNYRYAGKNTLSIIQSSGDCLIFIGVNENDTYAEGLKFGVKLQNIMLKGNGIGNGISTKSPTNFVSGITLDNIVIDSFEYGIHFEVTSLEASSGDSGNAMYDNYFNNIRILNTKIGFYLDGILNSSNSSLIWFNANSFRDIVISQASNIGICINNVGLFQENLFERITIEQIGNNFDSSLYEKYKVHAVYISAARADGTNKFSLFTGGYFENINPRITGDSIPDDADKCSVFYLNRVGIRVTNSLFYSTYKIYRGKGGISLITDGNTYQNFLSINGEYTNIQKSLLSLENDNNINYTVINIGDIRENNYRELGSTCLTSVLDYESDSLNYWGSLNIKSEGYVGEPFFFRNSHFIGDSIIYVNVNSTKNYIGYTPELAVASIDIALSKINRYGNEKGVNKIVLLSDITVSTLDNWAVKYPNLIIDGNGHIITISGVWNVNQDIRIINATIKINSTAYFRLETKNIEFCNCTFNVQDSFIYYNQLIQNAFPKVSFIYCTFYNNREDSKTIQITGTQNQKIILRKANCTENGNFSWVTRTIRYGDATNNYKTLSYEEFAHIIPSEENKYGENHILVSNADLESRYIKTLDSPLRNEDGTLITKVIII